MTKTPIADALRQVNATFNSEALKIIASQVAELEQAGEWRDISTAPKDGTDVLIFQAGYEGVYLCWYDDSDGVWFDERDNSYAPTHWLPLPSPPKEKTT